MYETITSICDVCELDIEVPNESGLQECPKCHNYTYVEQEDEQEKYIEEELEVMSL